jgi:hypothetical protein
LLIIPGEKLEAHCTLRSTISHMLAPTCACEANGTTHALWWERQSKNVRGAVSHGLLKLCQRELLHIGRSDTSKGLEHVTKLASKVANLVQWETIHQVCNSRDRNHRLVVWLVHTTCKLSKKLVVRDACTLVAVGGSSRCASSWNVPRIVVQHPESINQTGL